MTQRIHPVARYADARGAIAFFERAFGFTPRAVFDGPNGSVAHAELSLGTGTIGLSSVGSVDPANVWTTVREGVYATLHDVEAHHARARDHGARIEHAPHQTDYGSLDYTARDLEGRLWSFGTYAMSDAEGPPVFLPDLRYENGAAALAFLTQAFGLVPGLKVTGANGVIEHAELWLDDSPMMIGGGDPQAIWRGRSQCTQVYVADPDGHFARASAEGATIVRPLADTPYGARGYVAQDPEGFLWSFRTYRPTRDA